MNIWIILRNLTLNHLFHNNNQLIKLLKNKIIHNLEIIMMIFYQALIWKIGILQRLPWKWWKHLELCLGQIRIIILMKLWVHPCLRSPIKLMIKEQVYFRKLWVKLPNSEHQLFLKVYFRIKIGKEVWKIKKYLLEFHQSII